MNTNTSVGKSMMNNAVCTLLLLLVTVKGMAQPTISSFSPQSTCVGTMITISGSGFNGAPQNNFVFFGLVKATVWSASSTSLSVIVPVGASYGPISVLDTTTGLTGYSKNWFQPAFNNYSYATGVKVDSAKYFRTGGTQVARPSFGDLDGDGLPDMVVANTDHDSIFIFRNTSVPGTINTGTFANAVGIPTDSGPAGTAIADIDGDGKPDIVVVTKNTNKVYVFRNVSAIGTITGSSFASPVGFATGSTPCAVAVADINQDGKPDLLIANSASANFCVLQNTTTRRSITSSSFAGSVSFSLGTAPLNIAAGDMDNDGMPDVVISEPYGHTVNIYRNLGAGGTITSSCFSRVTLQTDSSPWTMDIGDLNGDGRLDIVTVNRSSNNINVLRNTYTSGTFDSNSFATRVGYNIGTDGRGVAIGDMDGDGKQDIVVSATGTNQILFFRSLGDSVFTGSSFARDIFAESDHIEELRLLDVDADGKIDVVTPNYAYSTISIYRNKPVSIVPTINLVSPDTANPGTSVTLTGTHFNATAAKNKVFFGATQATVTSGSATSLTVTSPAGATYKGISLLDTTAVLNAYQRNNFLPSYDNSAYIQNMIHFRGGINFAGGEGPNKVAIGDLDGDGKADMVVINHGSSTLSVYRNTSTRGRFDTGTFAPKVDFATGLDPSVVVLADIDGDGKLDIIVASGYDGKVEVYRNTSTTGNLNSSSFAAAVYFTVGNTPVGLAVGDLDGDGKPDIAVTDWAYTVFILRNVSTKGTITSASFLQPVGLACATEPYSVAIADMDGDGKPELVVSCSWDNLVAVYHNISTPGLLSARSFETNVNFTPAGGYPTELAVCDLDGDGKLDVVVANNSTNKIAVFRNTASRGSIDTGSLAAKVSFTVNSAPTSIAAGDLDADGKVDLVIGYFGSDLSVLRNTSTVGSITSGSLAARTDYGLPFECPGVAIGDLDGDGKPDIAVTSAGDTASGNSYITIMRNYPLFPIVAPGGTTVCPGGSVTLTDSTLQGGWTSSAPGIASVAVTTGVVTGVAAGTAIITYSVRGGFDTILVTVNPKPTIASVTPSSPELCIDNGIALTLTAGAKTGTDTFLSYNWSGPNGYNTTGAATTATFTPTTTAAGGVYSLTVTYAKPGCTSNPATSTVAVNARPTVASITPSATTICTASPLTLLADTTTGTGSLTSYNWTGPNSYSTTGTATTAVFTPSTTAASGVYSLTVTFPGTGCTSTMVSSAAVTVNNRPTISGVTASLSALCAGNAITFTAGTKTGTGTFLSYNWTGPNGYSATGTAVTATFTPTTSAASGVYSLTVTYPGAGCTSTAAVTSPSVTVTTRPTISGITASTNALCIGTGVSLLLSAGTKTGSGTFISYNWTGPNGYSTTGTATTANFTPTTTAAGGFYSLTVTYAGTGCTSAAAVTSPSVTVNARPTVAGITPSASTICTGSPLTLTAGAVTGGGTLTSYNWVGPNGYTATSAAANAVLTPSTTAASGTYRLTVTYTGSGCTSAQVNSSAVTVNNQPTIASITASLNTLCTGTALTLTAGAKTGTGTFTSYNWSGPNSYNTTGTVTTAVFTPTTSAASGVYSLTVTYPGTGCTSTAAVTSPSVTVNDRPTIAGITPSASTLCTGSALTLTAGTTTGTGALTSYNWTGPNGYSTAGTATTVTFTPSTTAASGVYSLTATYPGTGCTSAVVVTSPSVTVNVKPTIASITPSTTTICTSSPLTLTGGTATGTGTLTSYNWSGPSSYSATTVTNSAVYTPTVPAASAIYSLTVTYPGTGCTSNAVASSSVAVNVRPTVANVSASTNSLCIGSGTSVTLSAGSKFGSGSFISYNWSGPNSYSATGTTATATFTPTTTAADGSYHLTVTYAGTGCTSSTVSTSIGVFDRPTIAGITPSSTTLCTGTPLTLTAGTTDGPGTLTSYSWHGPNGYSTTGTADNVVFTPTTSATSGVYSVSVTYPGTSCTSATVVTSPSVTVHTRPIISGITPSATTLCTGNALTLTAGTKTGTGTFMSYNWSGPDSYNTTGTATTAVFTPTTTSASGVYSLTVTYAGTGCTSTAAVTSSSVTVNATPTITVTPSSASYCNGSSTSITASGAGTYSWSPATGLSATTGATVTSTATTTTTYTITGTATGCSGASTQTITVNPLPSSGTISGSSVVCLGSATTFTDAASGGTWSSSTPTVATVTGGTVTGAAIGSATISYSVTNGCGTAVATKNIDVNGMIWSGSTSSDWNAASNWACGAVPGITDNVLIPAGTTNAPVIGTSASANVHDITLASGATLTANSSATLNIQGTLLNNGTIQGNGVVILNGTTTQVVGGTGTVDNFRLNNTAGAAIQSAARLTINRSLIVSAGTLATNDSLVLYSDSANTAYVAAIPSGAAISGNVKVMQYIPGGMRRFRFWSHPFSNYIGLSQVQNYIDVTGAGGAASGFTTTGSNAASAFRYNPLAGNDSLSYDPGWKPYANTGTTTDSNRIHQYQGIRLFFRGNKGEGLGYGTYIPSPATVAQWGQLNQGTQNVTMTKGTHTHQDYNMIGNPYAAPVDIGTVVYNAKIAGKVVGSAYYVWNPNLGAAGQFQAIAINTTSPVPYYMQANCAFQVRTMNDGDALTFTENNKGTTATASLLRTQQDNTLLTIYDAQYHPWDMLQFNFSETASDKEDYEDATKPTGADFNFYSLSADNQKLAIDARTYADSKIIPLGINSPYVQDFIIKADNIATPAGSNLYLHDKLLNQYIMLQQGTEYKFTITGNNETQGNNRFELNMKPSETVAMQNSSTGLQVTLSPNPATDNVAISFTSGSKDEVSIRVLDISGVSVYGSDLGLTQNGIATISLGKLASGVYMVEVISGNQKVVQRLVKE